MRTFFYSTFRELNALNLEPSTSFSLMRTILTNNAALNYTADNFKVVDWIPFSTNVTPSFSHPLRIRRGVRKGRILTRNLENTKEIFYCGFKFDAGLNFFQALFQPLVR